MMTFKEQYLQGKIPFEAIDDFIEEWNGYFKGSIDLHGHQHNHEEYNLENLENGLRRYDVGVDANGMKPVSIAEVADFFA